MKLRSTDAPSIQDEGIVLAHQQGFASISAMSIIITLRLFAYDVGIEQGTIQYSPPITPGPSGLPSDLHRHCGGISHIRRAWGALKGVISK